mmetsp:Transcript_69987/g.81612  ORF Transcript_69987/g.81612 Transcript_69987/m.81612 type:complete len:308 (+) Transcript_69987:25-948(+)
MFVDPSVALNEEDDRRPTNHQPVSSVSSSTQQKEAAALLSSSGACGEISISKQDYEALIGENEQMLIEIEYLRKKTRALDSQITKLDETIAQQREDIDRYQELQQLSQQPQGASSYEEELQELQNRLDDVESENAELREVIRMHTESNVAGESSTSQTESSRTDRLERLRKEVKLFHEIQKTVIVGFQRSAITSSAITVKERLKEELDAVVLTLQKIYDTSRRLANPPQSATTATCTSATSDVATTAEDEIIVMLKTMVIESNLAACEALRETTTSFAGACGFKSPPEPQSATLKKSGLLEMFQKKS